ncbi:hypothetical protein [Ranid herpesvirus 3]|uniref:Helicase-primase helicase subunit n=1 Tax=Ranid herpesvirus 3 TaxID=1987509 RepID=A0A1X9T597_9VIRU|nr:hypothetical protein [Ranid herpesvirus 3]ARR28873.1 hypothetical protein [Ranid herpesvirus 3]
MNLEEYSTARQRAWAYDVVELLISEPVDKHHILLLAGDAGSGKSKTLCLLRDLLTQLGSGDAICVTATTHAAVASSEACQHTVYSALGINTNTLLSHVCITEEEQQRFTFIYKKRHAELLNRLSILKLEERKALETSARYVEPHDCTTLSNKCCICRHIVKTATSGCGPPALNKPVLVVDEYGILSASDINKIIIAADLLNMGKIIIILVGSVSQLCKPKETPIWQSNLFNEHYLHSAYLSHNYRQSGDSTLSDCLSALQHNVISKECVELINSRCIVNKSDALNPAFMPNALRIFNDNVSRNKYNTAMSEAAVAKGMVLTELPSHHLSGTEEYQTEIKTRYNLVFSSNKQQVIFIGAPVFLLKYGDKCGRGTVTGILKHKTTVHSITIRLETGEPVDVCRLNLNDPGRGKACFFPLVTAAAINTFSAQGATYDCEVLYSPPTQNYNASSIKASAYVACSRVRHSSSLFISCNSFAKNITTEACFFTPDRLKFKHLYEMGYNSI